MKKWPNPKQDEEHAMNSTRRKIFLSVGVTVPTLAVIPKQWSKPVIDSVLLPAHAQTSAAMCVTDSSIGGPLLGNPSGAATCQAACEAEATAQSAQLCAVTETVDGSGATQCGCDLDLP